MNRNKIIFHYNADIPITPKPKSIV